MSWLSKLIGWLKGPDESETGTLGDDLLPSELSPEREDQMLNRLANLISKTKMETPAIMFLEASKPLSTIFSDTVGIMFSPFLELFGIPGYDYALLFEKKENVERLIKMLEEKVELEKEGSKSDF